MVWSVAAIAASASVLSGVAHGFYIPGTAPTSYKEGEDVPLLVNHITPIYTHTKHEDYVYSFDYYYPALHFCQPEKLVKQPESLGSIIFGDRIYNSPFEIRMLQNEQCKPLCQATYPGHDAVFVNKLISSGFAHNWLIDGLPAARLLHDDRTKDDFYGAGFELGVLDADGVPVLNNHFSINIEYHERAPGQFRVVGVTVEPSSLAGDGCAVQEPAQPVRLSTDADTHVTFTYDVNFIQSDTVWATRWDKYLHVYDPKIQWFSLINFSLIVLCLSTIIAHILVRALKNDISKYNEMNLDDEFQEETGWKLVHGDVFRSPPRLLLLSVLVGSGIQLILMILASLGFALFGLLSPSNRGSLTTVMFILYALFGGVGSFVSASLYKLFGGENWRLNMALTPILVPFIIFSTVLFLNFFLIGANSSGAIPFGTLFAIVVLWFIISIPISIIGSIIAIKKEPLALPVRTNQIARQIPAQPWYLNTTTSSLLAGIFPFGAIAVEMYFIYSSLWFNRVFYMFGFLFFCVLLMIVTTALVSVLLSYYALCAENHKWQWRAVFIGGGCSVYVFIHAIALSKFQLGGFTTVVLYVGYSMLLSFLVFIATGAVGFLSSLFFIKSIYSAVKID